MAEGGSAVYGTAGRQVQPKAAEAAQVYVR